jgi:rare lipoprotein A
MMRNLLSGLALCTVSLILMGCVASPRFTFAKHDAGNSVHAASGTEEGIASYYAEEFNGKRTSNGETYDMNRMTAAHRTLPFNTKVRVTNALTGKSIVVRINDRGPFKDDRVIDLSLAAAKALELIGSGTAPVRLDVVEPGDTTESTKP